MTAPSTTPAATAPLTGARQAERRAQLAVWASGERVLEFNAASDRFCVDRLVGAADATGFALDDLLRRCQVQVHGRWTGTPGAWPTPCWAPSRTRQRSTSAKSRCT